MISDWTRSILAAAVTLGLAGTGCDLLSSNKDKDSDRTSDRLDRDSGIPRTAKVVDEDTTEVSYTAKADGRVYLFDVTDGRLKHNTNLREGDKYVADGEDDEITVNGRATKMSLEKAHAYRLYFDTSRDLDRNDRSDRNDRTDRDRNDRLDREDRGRVPDTAKVVGTARGGRDLSYRAPDDGTVYLWDNSSSRLVNTFNLDRGQTLVVTPDRGEAALDGRTVTRNLDTSSRNEYRLLFDRR